MGKGLRSLGVLTHWSFEGLGGSGGGGEGVIMVWLWVSLRLVDSDIVHLILPIIFPKPFRRMGWPPKRPSIGFTEQVKKKAVPAAHPARKPCDGRPSCLGAAHPLTAFANGF